MAVYTLFSTVDEILWKKVSTLSHFLKIYFLFLTQYKFNRKLNSLT